MKIVCPECQAAYEIDIPDSPSKNLSAKCAACHTTFPIKKRSLAESNHAHDSMTGPPLAQIDSGLAEESTDDFLSGLQEDLKGFEGLGHPHEESTEEKNLDDYLNQLVEEDIDEPDKEVLSESNSPSATDSAQPATEMPSEDDLDHLFDSLIAEEIKSPEKEEDIAGTFSEEDQEDGDLDALLDEIILNNLDEEDEPKPEPPASESEEIDEPVSGPLVDEEQEIELSNIEIPELKNLSPENVDDKISEEDILAKALSEESSSSEMESQEDSKETSEDMPETTASAPATEQQEEEKSDEDLWAEAFADQEAIKETDDKEPATEKQEEEKSDEDPSAETIVDQETTKETDDKEPVAEQEEEKSDEDLWAEAFADQEATAEANDKESATEQEEEKSDEDLWAEAFADQEATAEANDKESAAEQQEEEKSDEDSDQADESEELSEADDSGADAPDKEVTAEEIVAADVAMDLEEDDDPGEDTIANEFGISESDYDDDDEDEAEFSPPEKKKSIFSLPATRTGKLVLGGGVLAILLTAGGAYFALQTLAPSELTDMAKSPSEVPEGLQPKDTQENTAPQSPPENASPSPTEKPNPALTAALGADEPSSLTGDTKNPASAETKNGSGISQGLVAALAPGNHAVQLATIMPVAYSINDIRVLSFNLEAEMSDAKSAQVVREAMPVFEKITVTTVEQLMDKKFFNDILYVKEKLKKNLQNNFNKTLEGGGRVKKITLKEFTVR